MRFKLKAKSSIDQKEWHYWWAWRPVFIDAITIVLFEHVERRSVLGAGWEWVYRETDYGKDPVKHCEVYKERGCSFVDGPSCFMHTCSIRKQYFEEGIEKR